MQRRRYVIRTLALLSLPTLIAAPIVSTRAAHPPAPPRATVHVALRNFSFSPQTVTVAPGTTVVWTQQDQEPHTVTSDTQAWPDSGNLTVGHTFSHTFTTAGTYTYHCAFHPNMTAKIVVASTGHASTANTLSTGVGRTALVATRPAQVLVDGKGMTLYLYSPDKRNKSVCTGACASAWPPSLLPTGVSVPPALPGVSGAFGSTLRADGTRQITYEGAPLYTFVKDTKPGDMNGQGLGGMWWAVVVRPVPAGDDHGRGKGDDHALSTPGAPITPTAPGYYGGQSSDDRHGGSAHNRSATPTPTGTYDRGQGRDG